MNDAFTQVNRQEIAAMRAKFRAENGIPDEAFVIGYIGRWSVDKGCRELLSAWEELRRRTPDIWLLVTGKDEASGSVISLQELGALYDRTAVTEWLGDVRPSMAASDVVVVPSHREGFGMVAAEASALGVALVVSSTVGLIDAAPSGLCALSFQPGDSEALAANVEQLRLDPALRSTLARSGMKHAREAFRREALLPAVCDSLHRGGAT